MIPLARAPHSCACRGRARIGFHQRPRFLVDHPAVRDELLDAADGYARKQQLARDGTRPGRILRSCCVEDDISQQDEMRVD